ncbi:hypothetical protein [Desulfovibrio sp. ZJ200]|uniref:hypothetical protein n=1 Tax=Desulfovibrio sp. ZJ200 TaxID=2709792 RepID=UPI0013ED6764|nr:hypothetical protein [Desulfovibrio sp. ZJ200]
MRKQTTYPKQEARARFIFYAVKGSRCVVLRGASMDDILARLRELCPGGSFRELWEARA